MEYSQHHHNSTRHFANANGLSLCFESFGNSRDPSVILIMGLGAQMTVWPTPLCKAIARQGFYVIRFDNRDIGLSSKLHHLRPPAWHKVVATGFLRTPLNTPYSLNDMVMDTIGLLDALQIEAAHVVGSSMGGMIAQLTAIHFPDRVRSLSAIMTSSGAKGLPRGNLGLLWQLCRPRPKGENSEAALNRLVSLCQKIGSSEFMDDENYLRERLRSDIQRCYDPAGVGRQTAAVVTAPPRKKLLRQINTPTLVIHGTSDPILPYQHGIDLAQSIPNAYLELVQGMGHYLPLSLVARLAELLITHMKSAENPFRKSVLRPTIPVPTTSQDKRIVHFPAKPNFDPLASASICSSHKPTKPLNPPFLV